MCLTPVYITFTVTELLWEIFRDIQKHWSVLRVFPQSSKTQKHLDGKTQAVSQSLSLILIRLIELFPLKCIETDAVRPQIYLYYLFICSLEGLVYDSKGGHHLTADGGCCSFMSSSEGRELIFKMMRENIRTDRFTLWWIVLTSVHVVQIDTKEHFSRLGTNPQNMKGVKNPSSRCLKESLRVLEKPSENHEALLRACPAQLCGLNLMIREVQTGATVCLWWQQTPATS